MSQTRERLTVEPPCQHPHSTTTPFVVGGISRSLTAIARCALYDVPVVTRRVLRHMRKASFNFAAHVIP